MRSIQLVAQRTLEERQMPDPPDPGPGEVTVRLRAIGICGSDMHWYLDGRVGAIPAAYPLVLGHEPAGEIVAIGPGVTGCNTGERVVMEPSLTCGHCEYCLTGRHNLCPSCVFLGGPQAPGMFREYVTLPAHNTTPVPAAFTNAQATLVEPLAVMMHMLELAQIRPGDLVAVTGAGPIGMLAAATARAGGARRVYICDRLPHRLALARAMGVDVTLEGASRMVEAVMDETGGRGVDVVIEAAGAEETIRSGILVARRGGVVVLIGILSEMNPRIDVHAAMGKELRLQTIYRSNHRAQAAIDLIEARRIPTALITHTLPFSQTPRGFQMLTDYSDGVGKVVVEMK